MKKFVLRSVYFVAVAAFLLIVLEFAARAFGAGNPILYYNAAEGGMRPIPDQRITRGEDKYVTVDQFGFRSASTDTSAFKILYLGDSVTWGGTRIDDSSTFAERTSFLVSKEIGRNVYSMNAAVNGHSLMNQRDIYFDNGVQPDLIVWLFPGGDLLRSYATAGHLWPARFKPKFALVEVVDGLLSRFWSDSFRHKIELRDGIIVDGLSDDEIFLEKTNKDRRRSNLRALNLVLEDAKTKNIPVIVGVTPTKQSKTRTGWSGGGSILPEISHYDSVISIDLLNLIRIGKEDPDSLFVDRVHFNEKGHSVVSEILFQVILSDPRNMQARITEAKGLTTIAEANDEVYLVVQQNPELIGGMKSIADSMNYPVLAKNLGVEGRVYLQFIVDEKGNVLDPVVMKGIGSGCDQEAIRVVQNLKFEPGQQDGKPVKVRISLPITFQLEN